MAALVVTCESCGVIFESDWSEADAAAEAAKVFGGPIPPDQAATVCDGCYSKIMRFAAEEGWPRRWDAGPA